MVLASSGLRNDDQVTYIGFDLSTQQLKAIVIDDNLKIIHQAMVVFDSDLPEFRTRNGANKKEGTNVVTAPPMMWVKAMDMILDQLKVAGLDFATVVSIGGSAQQHGCVFMKKGAEDKMKKLNPLNFLHSELQDVFALREAPIWMDSSTTNQCKMLEEAIGGPEALARLTGSRGYERFTGNQIAKIYQTRHEVYELTERICCVSNFAASLLLGRYAPIDLTDGSGMNLLDIWSRKWSNKCLNACGANLAEKLGPDPVPSSEVLGNISPYFVHRYGFNEKCKIIAFMGDNPASMVGMTLDENDIGISLGTSDTVFLWLKKPKPGINGHVLCNPIVPTDHMALLCFKNGSLTRERIRDECAEGNWDLFNQLVDSIPRGNFGNIGFYFDCTEIYPPIKGDFRFNKFDERVASFSKEVEARACLEGQFLRLRLHSELLGYTVNSTLGASIKVTGGASCNRTILQILSDIFNRPVYRKSSFESACMGGAIMAKYALVKDKISFREMVSNLTIEEKICDPSADAHSIYTSLVERYRNLENLIKLQA